MDDSRLTNVNQLRQLLKGAGKLDLSLRKAAIEEKYCFIDQTVDRLGYRNLNKKDKRIVLGYLKKFTGYKRAQLLRLVKQSVEGELKRKPYRRVNPYRIYTGPDIKLLEKTDEVHLRLSEKATREILRREHEVFDHREYQTIAKISHGHITNLRHSSVYKSSWVNHTKSRTIPIGVTMPPENFSKPGSIRVDTVHQRDVFHINSVDEVLQWEIVVCIPQICEACMKPAVEDLTDQYPFAIFNFHSDRGGETINYQVANLLQHLLIKQTKSRANHTNDNALVESKNAHVVRKNMGWEHINQGLASRINQYYKDFFNPYLNFHRPCGYPTIIIDEKGRKKRLYKTYQTPYEALKKIPNASEYLKKGTTLDKLDIIAYACSDNEFAAIMRQEERKLFDLIRKIDLKPGSRPKA